MFEPAIPILDLRAVAAKGYKEALKMVTDAREFNPDSRGGVVMLAVAIFLVPRHGALGLALAFLGSYVVHALTVTAYAQIHLRNRTVYLESSIRPAVMPEL